MADFLDIFKENPDHDYSDDFNVSRVAHVTSDPVLALQTITSWISEAKADPTVTADLMATAGWDIAAAPLRRGRVSLRRGDFGEVIAAEAIEALDSLVVPIHKLRYQIDPDQALPGSDIVAIAQSTTGEIEYLHFCESKFRSNPRTGAIVEAIEQLDRYRYEKFATTINFIAHRLHETDAQLYSQFMRYLMSRTARTDTYGVCLTCDSVQWNEAVLEAVLELDDLLQPLLIRIITIDDSNDLVDQVCDMLELDLIEDD